MIESTWRRLRGIWRPTVRAEVDDEVSFHIAMRVDQFMASGMSRAEAELEARAHFGDVRQVSMELVSIGSRRRRRLDLRELLDEIRTDLRHAGRSLRAHWEFALAAISTLSLGIGASTAIFSVVNAVLIQPLPYGHADRLGIITQDLRVRHVTDFSITPGDLQDIRAEATLFDGIAAVGRTVPNTPFGLDGSAMEPAIYASVTPNIFDVLQVPVVRGRNFTAADAEPDTPSRSDSARGASATSGAGAPAQKPRIVIIGYDYWKRRFGADSSIVGKNIIGPWGPMLVVGVASPNAALLLRPGFDVAPHPDVWEAMRVNLSSGSRTAGEFRVIGRMKPGVSVSMARRQIDQIGADLRLRIPLRRTSGAYLRFEPMKDYLVGDVRPAILSLMAAVMFVLLIACANVANLLLVRASQRERELAVRAAIGGSPWRIIRQLLVESLLIAAAAGAIGVSLAMLGIDLLVQLAPANLPRLSAISIDGTVLAFTLVTTCAATIIFGLIPALRVSRPAVSDVLRVSGRVVSHNGTTRLRRLVVVAEVALSFVLLIGCGLMIRTFVALERTDLGFDPDGVLTFTLTNRDLKTAADREAFFQQVNDKLAAIPGVTAVTATNRLPLDDGGFGSSTRWGTLTARTDPVMFRQAQTRTIPPNYFDVMKTPIVAGRAFDDGDYAAGQTAIIIDDATARLAFGDEPAIGKNLLVKRGPVPTEFTVVGVARQQRYETLAGAQEAMIYVPWQTGPPMAMRWVVRASSDPAELAPKVRAAIAELQARLTVNDLQPMAVLVDKAMAATRFALVLIAIFATIAALLTMIGLYGVLSSAVRQRTSEIGIRMAFGAQASHIFSLVIGEGLRLSAAGVVIGIVLALAATRVMASMLVDVEPNDPVTFVAMTTVFLSVAFAACWLPARRAARLDPNAALREEPT